ncbi:MAG TPA: hypothetical protein VG095_05790 [Chthoniobacterales bacterium]|nr:hypothetical protein [Chthoniobacterales bacterium]
MPQSSASDLKVVPIGKKKCKPFILEVFVASPESGYKFSLVVEKFCTSTNDPLWKLVFDLDKKNAKGRYEQIVHVSFTPQDPEEQRGAEALATQPISLETALILQKDVHRAVKALEGVENPTEAQKKQLRGAMSKVARSAAPTKVSV